METPLSPTLTNDIFFTAATTGHEQLSVISEAVSERHERMLLVPNPTLSTWVFSREKRECHSRAPSRRIRDRRLAVVWEQISSGQKQ